MLMFEATDPKYFGDEDYFDDYFEEFTSYGAADPFIKIQRSDLTIIGTITEKIYGYDIPDEIVQDEPSPKTIRYNVEIEKVKKGTYFADTIWVTQFFSSNLDYDVNDRIVVMIENVNKKHVPYGGPFGMFKVIDDKAIGHEQTLELSVLFS